MAVQQLELLVRTALFKPATALVAFLLQAAAEQIDAAYQPKPGEQRKGRAALPLDCIFGSFVFERDYYHHPGKGLGHYPADAALGIEGGKSPALLRLVCLEGADGASHQKAEAHLRETGGISISARQIQRTVQQVGGERRRGKGGRRSSPCRNASPRRGSMSAPMPLVCRCARRNWRAARANNPMAAPKHDPPTLDAFLPSIAGTSRAVRSGITNRRLMFRA